MIVLQTPFFRPSFLSRRSIDAGMVVDGDTGGWDLMVFVMVISVSRGIMNGWACLYSNLHGGGSRSIVEIES